MIDLFDNTSPIGCDDEYQRILLARLALHQYRYLPFKKLRYRNLRKDFYDVGLIPKGYFSYCLSQKRQFHEKGALDAALDLLVDCGDLTEVYTKEIANTLDLCIPSRTQLFVSGDSPDENLRWDLEHLPSLRTGYKAPFRADPAGLLADWEARDKRKPNDKQNQWLYGEREAA